MKMSMSLSEYPVAAIAAPATAVVLTSCDSAGVAGAWPSAIVAAVVGGIALLIAWQQYQVAKTKLSLDLFDKRLPIFKETMAFLTYIVENEAPLSRYWNPIDKFTTEASFLFGPDIVEYMQGASRNASELAQIGFRARANGDVIQPQDIARDTELLNWFMREAQTGAKEKFRPYLEFGEWK